MPYYTYINKETGKKQKSLGLQSISEMEQYLIDNPHLELGVTGAPGFGDPIRLGVRKNSHWFTDRLKEMKKNLKHNTINVSR